MSINYTFPRSHVSSDFNHLSSSQKRLDYGGRFRFRAYSTKYKFFLSLWGEDMVWGRKRGSPAKPDKGVAVLSRGYPNLYPSPTTSLTTSIFILIQAAS